MLVALIAALSRLVYEDCTPPPDFSLIVFPLEFLALETATAAAFEPPSLADLRAEF